MNFVWEELFYVVVCAKGSDVNRVCPVGQESPRIFLTGKQLNFLRLLVVLQQGEPGQILRRHPGLGGTPGEIFGLP